MQSCVMHSCLMIRTAPVGRVESLYHHLEEMRPYFSAYGAEYRRRLSEPGGDLTGRFLARGVLDQPFRSRDDVRDFSGDRPVGPTAFGLKARKDTGSLSFFMCRYFVAYSRMEVYGLNSSFSWSLAKITSLTYIRKSS